MKKFKCIFLIIFLISIKSVYSQEVNKLEYQFVSNSQKITTANKLPTEVYKNQTRYFWIVNNNYNKWVVIQDKPKNESYNRTYYESFTISSIQNLSGGYKRFWTWDANNNRVIFLLNLQSAETYIQRSDNDSTGEIVKSVYYFFD